MKKGGEEERVADHPRNRAPDFLPFTKELPKDSTSQKKAKAADKGAKPKAPAAAGAAAAAVEKAADTLKNVKV